MKKPILIEILIWAFILTGVFCALIFTYSKLFVEPNIYVIQFKDIDGITKGSPVRFMGMNVGYVRTLKPKEKHIDVQIIVTKKDMKIPNGTVARVEFYGLGGSKSVELMPPNGSCDVGILTGDTIRINDVAYEAISVVKIIEGLERFVNGLNRPAMENILETVKNAKDSKIKNAGVELNKMEKNFSAKIVDIKAKQKDMGDKINKINENVEQINKFIKK